MSSLGEGEPETHTRVFKQWARQEKRREHNRCGKRCDRKFRCGERCDRKLVRAIAAAIGVHAHCFPFVLLMTFAYWAPSPFACLYRSA